MKKLFLSLAVVFSVAMVSCGGDKKAENNAEQDQMEAQANEADNQVAGVAEGVEMRDSITPDGDTIQVPVAAAVVVEETTTTAE